MDNTKESLILFKVTLELHCGHDWSVRRFNVTLDKDVGVDMDGMLGEIDSGLWNGSYQPAFTKDGFESCLDNIELDD